jgi:hypothetical protein
MNDNPIEIRDPALDEEDIRRRVQSRLAERRADNDFPSVVLSMGPSALQPGRMDTAVSPISFLGLNETLMQLLDQGTLVEPEFTSNVPVVGTIIVAFRRAWNWMSTKWYVRPILQQQTAINAQLIELVAEMTQWQELQAHELAVLKARLVELESYLEEDA